MLNDIHKGRDTTSSWSWVIDAAAIFLLVITVTGVAIQLLQRKRRRSGLITAGIASAAVLVLIWVVAH